MFKSFNIGKNLDLSEFITDDKSFYINSTNWKKLKKTYPKEEIIEEIVRLVFEKNLPFPGTYTDSDLNHLRTDYSALKRVNSLKMIKSVSDIMLVI